MCGTCSACIYCPDATSTSDIVGVLHPELAHVRILFVLNRNRVLAYISQGPVSSPANVRGMCSACIYCSDATSTSDIVRVLHPELAPVRILFPLSRNRVLAFISQGPVSSPLNVRGMCSACIHCSDATSTSDIVCVLHPELAPVRILFPLSRNRVLAFISQGPVF